MFETYSVEALRAPSAEANLEGRILRGGANKFESVPPRFQMHW